MNIIKFIEENLEVKYMGYVSEEEFIDKLYPLAKSISCKKRGQKNAIRRSVAVSKRSN